MDKRRLEVVLMPAEESKDFNILFYILNNVKLLAVCMVIGVVVGAGLGAFTSMRSNANNAANAAAKADITRYFEIDSDFLEQKTEERLNGYLYATNTIESDINKLMLQVAGYRLALIRMDSKMDLTTADALYTFVNNQTAEILRTSNALKINKDFFPSLLKENPPEALTALISKNNRLIQAFQEELEGQADQNYADVRIELVRLLQINAACEAILNDIDVTEPDPIGAKLAKQQIEDITSRLDELKQTFLDYYKTYSSPKPAAVAERSISLMQVAKYIIICAGGFFVLGFVFILLREIYLKYRNVGQNVESEKTEG